MLKQLDNYWQLCWGSAQQIIATKQVNTTETSQQVSVAQWFGAVASCLECIQQKQGDNVLLYQQDSLAFSAWFIALAIAGKHIVLPSDGQPTTLAMAGQYCDWQALEVVNYAAQSTALPLDLTLDSQSSVRFFTSGSTGSPKLIYKTLTQLLCEVQTLEQQFAEQIPAAAVVAGTVSTQHIYGLLFRVLWPLCTNRPFCAEQISYIEQWQALLAKHPMFLVASPAHLTRFDDLTLLTPHAANLSVIFSSGGPLPDLVPRRYVEAVGSAPIEVFGSTETGGIGYRQRSEFNTEWHAFAGVKLFQDLRGALAVVSPHLPDQQPYQTEDNVQLLSENRFRLLGRLDRIIKLEEKRLSLPELETFCQQSSLVAAAVALQLTQPKVQLALVVVLSESGQALLNEQGKLQVSRLLKQHLLQRFERVLLPRRFRYLSALPYNNQGKLPRAQLEALFEHE